MNCFIRMVAPREKILRLKQQLLISKQNHEKKITLCRSIFWTLLVTRFVRERSYETINLIGTHCVRTYRIYS